MQVRNMLEIDLNGVLFIHFPLTMSLETSLRRLEAEITFAALEDDVEEEEVAVSPFWVFRALFKRGTDEYDRMTPDERQDAVAESWQCFTTNRRQPTNQPANQPANQPTN